MEEDMLPHETVEELVNGLLKIFEGNILQIILYGSVARREATEDSDIDIAIILREKFDSKTKEKFITWAAGLDMKYEKVFSIIDIEKENLEKWGDILPFYKNVCQEGITLWKAA